MFLKQFWILLDNSSLSAVIQQWGWKEWESSPYEILQFGRVIVLSAFTCPEYTSMLRFGWPKASVAIHFHVGMTFTLHYIAAGVCASTVGTPRWHTALLQCYCIPVWNFHENSPTEQVKSGKSTEIPNDLGSDHPNLGIWGRSLRSIWAAIAEEILFARGGLLFSIVIIITSSFKGQGVRFVHVQCSRGSIYLAKEDCNSV